MVISLIFFHFCHSLLWNLFSINATESASHCRHTENGLMCRSCETLTPSPIDRCLSCPLILSSDIRWYQVARLSTGPTGNGSAAIGASLVTVFFCVPFKTVWGEHWRPRDLMNTGTWLRRRTVTAAEAQGYTEWGAAIGRIPVPSEHGFGQSNFRIVLMGNQQKDNKR